MLHISFPHIPQSVSGFEWGTKLGSCKHGICEGLSREREQKNYICSDNVVLLEHLAEELTAAVKLEQM